MECDLQPPPPPRRAEPSRYRHHTSGSKTCGINNSGSSLVSGCVGNTYDENVNSVDGNNNNNNTDNGCQT